ncbi:MAG: phage/plasmid primase, P4 family [Bacteroidaceae bacterium]|nr:phage/plasmid primase, P4 family [Bacteroidaceae bacterium]
MTFFDAYIKTKHKRCVQKFKGVPAADLMTYEQASQLDEFAGRLAPDAVLIDIDDKVQGERLLDIVDKLQLNCQVRETTRGFHFYFKNAGIDKCGTHVKLALGLSADIKVGSKCSYAVLKTDGKERPVVYDIEEDEQYQTVPRWLFPVGNSGVDLWQMGDGDGRNQALFNYILTLQSAGFTKEEIRECITIINDYILKKPLPKTELETILRDEAFTKPSFFNDKGTFLFDVFAKYLISAHNIVKINGQLHIYKDGVYVLGYNEIESQMIKHISNLNQQKRKEVLSYLNLLITENKIPTSASCIAFSNGVYDLDTGQFMDFSPSLVITNKINHNYNPSAYSQVADKTLDKLSCNDPAIRALLEEVIGYCFYRRNELRKAFILTGDKHNGKSTFLDMIMSLLGTENTVSLDLKELGDRFKTAELFGKLANIGDDIGDEFIANPAVFKKVVSGDRINAERKGQDPFDFNSYAKQLFSANNIPRIKDKSGAVIDRLIIVPFEASFTKDDPDFDPYIKYKLREESVMEYLIQLGLKGLVRVLENRAFTTSGKIVEQLQEYEESNNPILLFFKENTASDIANEPTKTVYARYNEFCIVNGFSPISNIEFSKQVKKFYALTVTVKRVDGKSVRIFSRE